MVQNLLLCHTEFVHPFTRFDKRLSYLSFVLTGLSANERIATKKNKLYSPMILSEALQAKANLVVLEYISMVLLKAC